MENKSDSSTMFTFIVGEGRKEIATDPNPLAKLSSPLNTLINGPMMEAELRRVDWSEVVEEDTFARLCEFAKLGDYTPPTFLVRERPRPATGLRTPSCMWLGCNKGLEYKFEQALKCPNEFCSLPKTANLAVRSNAHHWQDFTPVFLGHAKLYLLADTYDIPSLAELAFHRLGRTLKLFTLFEQNISDVTELIRFCYDKTRPNDPLRRMVATHAALVAGEIGHSADFKELLVEGGDFVLDFWNLFHGHVWANPRQSV